MGWFLSGLVFDGEGWGEGTVCAFLSLRLRPNEGWLKVPEIRTGTISVPLFSVVQSGRAFVLLDGIATVNDDQLAGDIRGGFGGEKCDRGRDFVRAAGAADGSIFTSDDFVLG